MNGYDQLVRLLDEMLRRQYAETRTEHPDLSDADIQTQCARETEGKRGGGDA